ncbi:MAG TPA: hypothetical protein VIL85_19045 [Thermomicrobiales bacterium]|jgi:hypothetical protein
MRLALLAIVALALLCGCGATTPNIVATQTRAAELSQIATLTAPTATATTPPPPPTVAATATPAFARYTAATAIRAFDNAGLRMDNVQPLQNKGIGWGVTVRSGQTFAVGVLPTQNFYLIECDTAAELDAARSKLAGNTSRYAPRFFVKYNLILVTTNDAPTLAQRYETVLNGLP